MSIILIFISIPIYIYIIGLEAIFGYIILLVIAPVVSAITAHKQKYYMHKGLVYSDKRLKLSNEMLTNIRVVKMYAWEISLIEKIQSFRKAEVKYYKLVILMKTLAFIFNNITEALTISLVLLARIFIFNKTVDVTSMYIMYLLIKAVKYPISHFLQHFESIIDGLVSIDRIQSIFDSEEKTDDIYPRNLITHNYDNNAIMKIQHMNFKHSPNINEDMLYDINLTIKRQEVIAVVGNFASGKSSLLSSILREKYICFNDEKSCINMPLSKDITYGYAGHDDFIINATIRENIIMNEMYDDNVYTPVIDACALKHDLSLFAAADLTEIGEKGINISGGQKARICIARIIYKYMIHQQNASKSCVYVILLDDKLSAVDMDVAMHIANNAIFKLCTKATIIMTLNSHFNLLHKFDRIIVMKKYNNKCFIDHNCSVNVENLNVVKTKYAALLQSNNENNMNGIDELKYSEQEEDEINVKYNINEQKQDYLLACDELNINAIEEQDQDYLLSSDENSQLLQKEKNKFAATNFISQEDRVKGKVNRSSLIAFITDGYGITVLLLILIQYIMFEIIFVAFEYFINMFASSTIQLSHIQSLFVFIGFIIIYWIYIIIYCNNNNSI
eukprot:63618_1